MERFTAGVLTGAALGAGAVLMLHAFAPIPSPADRPSLYDGPPLSGQQCAAALMDARRSHAADLEQCNMIAQVYVQYVETSKEAAMVCAQLIEGRKQCLNTQ